MLLGSWERRNLPLTSGGNWGQPWGQLVKPELELPPHAAYRQHGPRGFGARRQVVAPQISLRGEGEARVARRLSGSQFEEGPRAHHRRTPAAGRRRRSQREPPRRKSLSAARRGEQFRGGCARVDRAANEILGQGSRRANPDAVRTR